MKKKAFIELIHHYPDDIDIFIDGAEQFIVAESVGEDDNKFINIIKHD